MASCHSHEDGEITPETDRYSDGDSELANMALPREELLSKNELAQSLAGTKPLIPSIIRTIVAKSPRDMLT
ncbi:hypothetical protein DPMN_113074 [Dreissena polymorpha]|uniref:Uncharacterized protein n=1 Tax=Dreissena polymorpha TaxID=45954 RepID=A0A9D4QR89_DREPO|nr:hypothetical protein DPMN_113074 [Dreissena polymorpha]